MSVTSTAPPVGETHADTLWQNYVAVSLWSLEADGAKVGNLSLVSGPVIQSGYGTVELSPLTGWASREGAY